MVETTDAPPRNKAITFSISTQKRERRKDLPTVAATIVAPRQVTDQSHSQHLIFELKRERS